MYPSPVLGTDLAAHAGFKYSLTCTCKKSTLSQALKITHTYIYTYANTKSDVPVKVYSSPMACLSH